MSKTKMAKCGRLANFVVVSSLRHFQRHDRSSCCLEGSVWQKQGDDWSSTTRRSEGKTFQRIDLYTPAMIVAMSLVFSWGCKVSDHPAVAPTPWGPQEIYPGSTNVLRPERRVRHVPNAQASVGEASRRSQHAAPTTLCCLSKWHLYNRYIRLIRIMTSPQACSNSTPHLSFTTSYQSTHPMAHTEVDSSLPIVWRDSADPKDYEEARVGRVFNQRRPQRFPIAVVLAETDSHVLQAVQLANKLDCRVSVRSGGHSWAAWSVRDNAVLIELGKLKHISVDKEAMIASVSPSTTGQMLNDALSAEGLMFCGGHCPDVGLGGFLLQGGMGWNCRVSAVATSDDFPDR